jgi:uncharacterized membrane protein YvlD (DUF360 family)
MTLGSIKKMLYQAILAGMVFFITMQIVTGITTSGLAVHLLMALAVYAAANMLVIQIIKFFTIPKNLFTYWLASAVLSFGAIYIMSVFLPGITIEETILDPVSLGIISVNPYVLTPMLTMVLAALVSGLFNAVLYWLDSE